jgi:DNA replication protein DnaC
LRDIWKSAVEKDRDGWAYNGVVGMYEVPIKPFREIVQAEIDRCRTVTVGTADIERLMVAADKEQAQRDGHRKQQHLAAFTKAVGPRFASATLESYRVMVAEQRKALDSIRQYAGNIKARVAAGEGIILFGSAGTGKTHLLAAVGKVAIEAGMTVEWTNGQDLFARFRAAIGGDESEDDIVRELVAADVLVLDDVLPPGGVLTEYQATTVFRTLDCRYRAVRPTWATMNVAGGEEAAHGMGAQVVDRLRDGALTLFCNWPSFRRAQS